MGRVKIKLNKTGKYVVVQRKKELVYPDIRSAVLNLPLMSSNSMKELIIERHKWNNMLSEDLYVKFLTDVTRFKVRRKKVKTRKNQGDAYMSGNKDAGAYLAYSTAYLAYEQAYMSERLTYTDKSSVYAPHSKAPYWIDEACKESEKETEGEGAKETDWNKEFQHSIV